jgi:hypothetical protein
MPWYLWIILLALLLMPFESTKSILQDSVEVLPRLLDTEIIELYHLHSFPTLLIETSIGSFSTQTSGLALRSLSSDNIIVLQYKPRNYSGCFLPYLSQTTNGTVEIVWDKNAEIIYDSKLDVSYWQQSTFLGRMNGVVYKKYVVWLQEFIIRNKLFSPQSICSNEFEYHCFTQAVTWETFLSERYER